MIKIKRNIAYALIIMLTFTACVSKKKFVKSENDRQACMEREINLNAQNIGLNKQIEFLKKQVRLLAEDTTGLSAKIREYETKMLEYNQMISSNLSEKEKLNLILKKKNDDLKDRERKINELDSISKRQSSLLTDVMGKINGALVNFKKDELTVEMKDGKVYISMADKLLFPSGSSTLDERGKTALGMLASVLKEQPNLDMLIIGHTDSIPIKTNCFKDNWDLSVSRANNVVRILTETYKISPIQIMAAGKSEYSPVSTNETKEGRALNRRIEIVILPRLDELYNLIQKK
ncbi:MAG: flagellar motor protein MotB [Bacteroidetes bacterium]|nr:flagellar motor protein MotB [Bacteroidota bacterium]